MPLHFRASQRQRHRRPDPRDTWDLLCQLTGRRDFLYVADSKLATSENMTYLAPASAAGSSPCCRGPAARTPPSASGSARGRSPGSPWGAKPTTSGRGDRPLLDRSTQRPHPEGYRLSGITASGRPNWTWPRGHGTGWSRLEEALRRTCRSELRTPRTVPPRRRQGREPWRRRCFGTATTPRSGSTVRVARRGRGDVPPGAAADAPGRRRATYVKEEAVRFDARRHRSSESRLARRTTHRRDLPAGDQRPRRSPRARTPRGLQARRRRVSSAGSSS